MASDALQKLRQAFTGATGGAVTLDAAFWTAAGLTPPADLDKLLLAGFHAAGGLALSFDATQVGPIQDDRFTISAVHFPFFDADDLGASLVARDDGETPLLLVTFSPATWRLTQPFPFLAGTIFDLFAIAQPSFLFASASADVALDAIGRTVRVAAGLTTYGMVALPDKVQFVLDMIGGLPIPAPTLPAWGSLDFSAIDPATNIGPSMSLAAPLPFTQNLRLFFLDIGQPRLGFSRRSVEAAPDPDEDAPTPEIVQVQDVFLACDLSVENAGTAVALTLEASLPSGKLAQSSVDFRIVPAAGMAPLTPQAAMALVAGANYFELVPAPLRTALASIKLEGATLTGLAGKAPRLGSLGIRLGSIGRSIDLFKDPTTNAPFTLETFSLTYLVTDPLDAAIRTTSADLRASFTLFPTIFRQKGGQPGGLFEIAIDQTLDFEGAFTGQASLDDVLRGITGGAIGLPSGISVVFSDIYLTVRSTTRSYTLEFTLDADVTVPFLSDGGRPLISLEGLHFVLGASTPKAQAGTGARTVYTGSMRGLIAIGDLVATVAVLYDGGAAVPLWRLSSTLAQPLSLSDLLDRFFRKYDLPDLLPGHLQVESFAIEATIPGKSHASPRARLAGSRRPDHRASLATEPAAAARYTISGTITWRFSLGPIAVDAKADIGLAYDGSFPAGQRYSGSVIATIDIERIGAIDIGYRFGPADADAADGAPAGAALATASGDSTALWLSWKGFRAAYDRTAETVTFTLKGVSLGSLLTDLVAMIGGNPYFTLPSPWNALNAIALDGLVLTFHLRKLAGQPRVSAAFPLPSTLDLGLLSISAIRLTQVDGKVRIGLVGSSSVPSIAQSSLFKEEGQDVSAMPAVPGRGNSFFDLRLLALGQRVAIQGAGTFGSTKGVIEALGAVPASAGSTLPIDPSKPVRGQPIYDPGAGWLAAMSFGLLRIGDGPAYAIDLMIVFDDPDLYGLRLALSGAKVKVLDGLVLDVLYKKVSDDIGCYQIEFTLPSALRNLDFGAFAVTLPVIGLQIYTNGDFLVDFGFPYHLDFSRSFTVQAIIMGVPVIGSAGFYFGKLSSATDTSLPVTAKGTFHPVIVFGFGAQLGLGKTIDKGILKAGFMITIFGIIEGTIAAWHPYEADNRGDAGTLQGDYYFKLVGSFGLIGRLYGSIDFAIIKADVSLTVQVVAAIAYESFRAIPLSLSASVSVSVSVSIDCGFFSISIGFSFSTTLHVALTIGDDSHAPWDGDGKALVARHLHALALSGPVAHFDMASALAARPRIAAAAKETLSLTAVPQFTILGPQGGTAMEGAFVLLFVMDAPGGGDHDSGDQSDGAATSFGKLCAALLPWLLAGATTHAATVVGLAEGAISRLRLEAILTALADPAKPPFDAAAIELFLSDHFRIEIHAGDETLEQTRRDAHAAGTTIFPALPALSLSVPDPAATSGSVTIDLARYAAATPAFEAAMREHFAAVAATVEHQQGDRGPEAAMLSVAPPQPIAACVLVDYIQLLGRQLVQAAIDSFDDYAYPLDATTRLDDILAWADTAHAGQVELSAIAQANLLYPLTPDHALAIGDETSPLTYTVQAADTPASIAARYAGVGGPALVLANSARNNLVAAGARVTVGAASTLTLPGDSFTALARRLGIDLPVFAADPAVQTQAGLLASGVTVVVPGVKATTATGDTLQGLMQRFSVPLVALLGARNRALAGLFAPDPTLRFAIPNLAVLPEAALWPAILRTGTLGHLAGMASRTLLHGMRMPVLDGLSLPANFLYGAAHWPAQSAYGLYQLTGQQFPLAETNAGASLGLSRPGTGYDWLALGGGAAMTVALAATRPNSFGPRELLTRVLASVRAKGYAPLVTGLTVEPAVALVPKRYAMGSAARWTSSDLAGLLAVTQAPGAPAQSGAQPQARPILWALSSALMREAEARQAALAGIAPDTRDQSRYMPVLAPNVGMRDPATGATRFEALEDYALATRIDFKVKHLAQDVDLAPQGPLANAIVPPSSGNAGSPSRALAPFAYEIVGPGAAQAVLLERLLSAMADQGEAIVSGLFLAYADAGTGGLIGRAPEEFLAFIVQSNLSTETAPSVAMLRAALAAPAEPPAPRGIANGAAEFVRRLWELSTVAAGGSYLFFQLVAEGAGLPASLFDASGQATLTLVVTYAREAVLDGGARLSNAMNALVTTSAIDPGHAIVDLVARPAPAASLAMAADATARGMTAGYGIALGALARANRDAPLRPGVRLPMAGLYRQLGPADLGHGDPLAALASFYSVGAVTALTAADLAAFNPGVVPADGALIRIPPFVLQVAAGGLGASLAAISAHYDADPTALLVGAADAAGLFAGPTLTIETETFDAHNALGLGNIGLGFQRERGDRPTPLKVADPQPVVDAYARAMMLQLYQLAVARLRANAFSSGSVDSAPFGPLARRHAPAMRRLRTDLPADAGPYSYTQALGIRASARLEAAPDGAGPLSAAGDPYRGIGGILQAELAWQDLFGNRLPGAFAAGTAGLLAAPVLYPDRLLPLDQWPSTSRSHRYDGDPGAPVLHLELAFDPTPYNPSTNARGRSLDRIRSAEQGPAWQRNARDDLARFTLIRFQIVQDYDSLGIPGLTGRAVTITLRNSLLATPAKPLADDDRAKILAYVEAAIAYLDARARAAPGQPPQAVVIQVPVAPAALVATTDIVEIAVALEFERRPDLVAPALRGIAGGLRASSTVPPHGDAPDAAKPVASDDKTPVGFQAYAQAFERVFTTADWVMRVGSAAADPAAPADARAGTLWAVRMAKPGRAAGPGIGFAIGGTATYYAPLPIASALQTFTTAIRPYATGTPYDPKAKGVPTTFASADPNAWLAECLTALDDCLAATYATPCFVLDRLLGRTDTAATTPALRGYLATLLAHKATLAAAIASTVRPVLAQPDDHHEAARDKLEQALLRRLDAVTTLACVAVLPVTGAKADCPPGETPPRLFGQPLGTPVEGEGSRNFSLSTAKIALTPRAGSGDASLAFLVTAQGLEAQAYVPLALAWAPTHVEHAIGAVRGIEGYQRSRWITFVTPEPRTEVAPAGGGAFAIPVALRALPMPASVTSQSARWAGTGSGTPQDLARWTYNFGYLLNQAAQDSVVATVEFNLPPSDASGGSRSPDLPLYDALAQFVSIHKAVSRDIDAALRGIDGRAKPVSPEVRAAELAVAAFTSVVGEVAAAYQAWAEGHRTRALLAPALPAIVYTFEIVLDREADGSALLRVVPQSFQRDGAAAPYALPLAAVEIDPANYAAEVVTSDPATGAVAWRYNRKAAADPALPALLPYEAARLDPRRTVSFSPLDVLELQSAWSAVRVLRNRHLAPDGTATSEAFQFASAPSRFADPVVPFLRHAAVALDATRTTPRPVAAWLSGFFGPLLAARAERKPVQVGIEAGYRYAQAASAAVPVTRVPVALAAPASDPSAAVAGEAQAFFDHEAPRKGDRAGFDFAVTIFSAAGHSDLPLLQIGALTLEAASVA